MSIYENCLLVSLSVSMPPQTRKAVGASTKVERENHTQSGKVAVVKSLFSKQDIKPLQRIATDARKYIDENSLPYGKHQRIIRAENYFDFVQEFVEIKNSFEHQKKKFLGDYHLALSRAWFELGSLYEEANYPTLEELDDRICMVVETNVISPTNAFDKVAGFDEKTVTRLQEEALVQQQKNLAEAMKSLVERLYKTLKHAVSRLSDEDAVFHKTLISNISDSVKAIRNLNLTDDEELTMLADKVEEVIEGITAEELRQDKVLRKETAEEAKEIIEQMADYF